MLSVWLSLGSNLETELERKCICIVDINIKKKVVWWFSIPNVSVLDLHKQACFAALVHRSQPRLSRAHGGVFAGAEGKVKGRRRVSKLSECAHRLPHRQRRSHEMAQLRVLSDICCPTAAN